MAIFYHGTQKIFDKFDLSHAFDGDGKCKFGFGVYVTERFETAAHYALGKDSEVSENTDYYVYTVEVPDKTDDNYIISANEVNRSIIEKAEKKSGEAIPEEACKKGKYFRKYIGNKCAGNNGTISKMIGAACLDAEKKAVEFLLSIGIRFLEWPTAQSKPDGLQNRAILDEKNVTIIRIEKVLLDKKSKQLIQGSKTLVKEFYR